MLQPNKDYQDKDIIILEYDEMGIYLAKELSVGTEMMLLSQ